MVTVVKERKRHLDATVRMDCMRCGSTLEFTKSEAAFFPDIQDGNRYVVNCPVVGCGAENWLPEGAL
jgi:hypothetical protein